MARGCLPIADTIDGGQTRRARAKVTSEVLPNAVNNKDKKRQQINKSNQQIKSTNQQQKKECAL